MSSVTFQNACLLHYLFVFRAGMQPHLVNCKTKDTKSLKDEGCLTAVDIKVLEVSNEKQQMR